MSDTTTTKKRGLSGRIGAGLLAGAALISGFGAFAAFSDTESAERHIAAGELDIEMGPDAAITGMAPGDIWSRPLTIDIPAATNDTDLIEFIQLDLDHDATAAEILGQHMDNGAPGTEGSSSLWSDAEGLRLVIQNCEGGTWTETGSNTGLFTCDGTVVDVEGAAGAAAITGPASITAATKIDSMVGGFATYGAADFGVTPTADGTIPDGTSMNLLATFALPGDNLFGAGDPADNSYENAALPGMEFIATAIQRAGIAR